MGPAIKKQRISSFRNDEQRLAIDLIRVCDLSSKVLAINEARWPIEKRFRIFKLHNSIPRLGHGLEALSTSSRLSSYDL